MNKKRAWIILTLFLFACEKRSEIGLTLNPDQGLGVVKYIEIPLPAKTIIRDSIFSAGIASQPFDQLICGQYDDPVFGKVRAKAFTQWRSTDFNPTINLDAVYDSMVMTLRVDYYYGQIIDKFHIKVHELTEKIDTVVYLNSDTIPYRQTPLADTVLNFIPDTDTLLHVILDKEFGLELFNAAKEQSDIYDSALFFRELYPGLALIPGDNGNAIIGFEQTNFDTEISLHYHYEDADTLRYESINFDMATLAYLNQITPNIKQPTNIHPFDQLTDPRAEYDFADGKVYVEAGTGITSKLSLEHYFNFIDTLDHLIVNKAELSVENVEAINLLNPTASIFFILTDSTNLPARDDAGEALSIQIENPYSIGGVPFAALTGNIKNFFYDDENKEYKEDVTSFLQAIFDGFITHDQMFILPSDDNKTVNRFVINNDDIKLRIYYTTTRNP